MVFIIKMEFVYRVAAVRNKKSDYETVWEVESFIYSQRFTFLKLNALIFTTTFDLLINQCRNLLRYDDHKAASVVV